MHSGCTILNSIEAFSLRSLDMIYIWELNTFLCFAFHFKYWIPPRSQTHMCTILENFHVYILIMLKVLRGVKAFKQNYKKTQLKHN